MRIGHGFDVHRFAAMADGARRTDSEITIGGVKIAHERALEAHSDGDVLIHALCDALLGAAGLGDIGQHFPDTDPAYKGIDSRELLRASVKAIALHNWRLANADITLIAQAPKFSPHKEQMKINLARDLECEPSQLNIKATTTEGLGYAGRKEGIACHAVVLLASV